MKLICDEIPFEVKLWNAVTSLLADNKQEKALLLLYSELIDQLKNIDNCNNFILYVSKFEMNSDLIVHILNALSPVRNLLTNWDEFVSLSTEKLIKQVGEPTAQILLKVIV